MGAHVFAELMALEGLLTLFARLLPISAIPSQRKKFIEDVFLHPKKLPPDCAQDIISIIEQMQTADWDGTAAKLMKTLAAADMSL